MVNPAVEHVLQYFSYDHLPPHLQSVSKPFYEMAQMMAAGETNQETTVALRKLLEAKDAYVRSKIKKRPSSAIPDMNTTYMESRLTTKWPKDSSLPLKDSM